MTVIGNFLTSILIFLFCASAQAQSVSFESQAFIRKNNEKQTTEIKEKETISLVPGESILVQNKLGFPLLIFAAKSTKTTIQVSDADFETAMQSQMQPEVERRTSEIIDTIRSVENAIQKRDYNQASSNIINLKSKYKNVSAILFLSGTVNYLINNKAAAVEDLKNGLQLNPNNTAAKRLLDQLRGDK